MEEVTGDMLSRETKQVEKEKTIDIEKTTKIKNKLVNDIKNGLGVEMMKNPSKVRIIKKTRYQKFIANLQQIFTKF